MMTEPVVKIHLMANLCPWIYGIINWVRLFMVFLKANYIKGTFFKVVYYYIKTSNFSLISCNVTIQPIFLYVNMDNPEFHRSLIRNDIFCFHMIIWFIPKCSQSQLLFKHDAFPLWYTRSFMLIHGKYHLLSFSIPLMPWFVLALMKLFHCSFITSLFLLFIYVHA